MRDPVFDFIDLFKSKKSIIIRELENAFITADISVKLEGTNVKSYPTVIHEFDENRPDPEIEFIVPLTYDVANIDKKLYIFKQIFGEGTELIGVSSTNHKIVIKNVQEYLESISFK